MEKIISLFRRNYDGDRLVRDEIVPGAEWVINGEGVATRKWDGTCCLIRDGKLFKRYDAKRGKTPPTGFEPAQDPDPKTGHWPGWLPVGDGPEDRWHREAFARTSHAAGILLGREEDTLAEGTWELCGPHVQGNPERLAEDLLIKHGAQRLDDVPRDFEGLRLYFAEHDIEGIVWHHSDGRMVKIKAKDFGLRRHATASTS